MDIRYDDWTIIKRLGSGNFGSVYEIERKDFGVYKAALKVISIPQNPDDVYDVLSSGMSEQSVSDYYNSMVQDIVTEIELMYKLKGMTNIVSYEHHKVIPHEDSIGWDIYIRMELLTPLEKHIHNNPLSEADVVRLGIDICRALERCHKLKVIHRDIKPANIFVSEQDDFKLGDFGIARTVEKTASNLSRKGTYNYMAPEVYTGKEYGLSVDIYSLGLVMYRLLNHNRNVFLPPYTEPFDYKDQESALIKRISGTPLPYPDNAPKALGDVILKACAFRPEDRFQSPVSFRHALERVVEYSQTLEGIVITVPLAESEEINDEKTLVDNKKSKKPVIIGIIAAIVIIIILLIVLLPKNDTSKTAETNIESESIPETSTTKAPETTAVVTINMPDCVGKQLSEVQKELEDEGLIVISKEADGAEAEGIIQKQSVKSGESLESGETVTLTVSKGNQVKIPSFKNKSLKKVQSSLEELGLTVNVSETLVYDEKVDAGNVASVTYMTPIEESSNGKTTEDQLKKGAVVNKGTSVTIYLSGIKVPENIYGMAEADAKNTLTERGFEVSENTTQEYSATVAYGSVINVQDASGAEINTDQIFAKGTPVSLKVSIGAEPDSYYYEEPVEEPTYNYEPATEPQTEVPTNPM